MPAAHNFSAPVLFQRRAHAPAGTHKPGRHTPADTPAGSPLFGQPALERPHGLLTHRLGQRGDPRAVAAARLDEGLHVALVGRHEPRRSGSRPRIVAAVNHDHAGIVLLQVAYDLAVEPLRELLAAQLLREEDAAQVVLRIDRRVGTEGLRIVGIVAQFAGGLHEEGSLGIALGEVVG